LEGESWELRAGFSSQRVQVWSGPERPPFSVAVPLQALADRVIAELRSLGRDRNLRETILTLD
jgi:hypothetical protein